MSRTCRSSLRPDIPGATFRIVSCSLVGLLLALPGTAAQAAGPTSEQPLLPLTLWGTDPEPIELHATATKLFQEQSTVLASLIKRKDGDARLIKLTEVGNAHVALRQLDRAARRLIFWNEPAGTDFSLRGLELQGQLKIVVGAVKATNGKQISNGLPTLGKRATTVKKQLPRIRKLVEKKQFQEAEDELMKLYDELEIMGVWYDTLQERNDPFSEIDALVLEIQTALEPVRKEKTKAAVTAARAKLRPNLAPVLKKIDEAASSLSASGQVEIAGAQVPGPQAFSRFVSGLQQIRLASLRFCAVCWADFEGEGRTDFGKLEQEYADFHKAVIPALVKMVAADAGRVSADQAAKLYSEYLTAVATLSSLVDQETITREFGPTLDSLSAKSPQLPAEIKAYQTATGDLLRWRTRIADMQSTKLKTTYSEFQPGALVKPMFEGIASAPTMINDLKPQAIGKEVRWNNLIGSPKGGLSTSPFVQYLTFRTPVTANVSAALATMKRDLLISDTAGPLTLATALALDTTARGDVVEAGGKITGFELDGYLPIVSRLGIEEWGLAAASPPGGRWVEGPELPRQVRWRIDLAPKWFRLPYSCVILPDAK